MRMSLAATFATLEAAAPPFFVPFFMSSMLRREEDGSGGFCYFPSFREPDLVLLAFGLLLTDAAEVIFILRESSLREPAALSDGELFVLT